MATSHRILFCDSRKLEQIAPESVELIVTSPPYPMIGLWDEMFREQNPDIASALAAPDPDTAFELMHRELDPVWEQAFRVLKPGGIACINIGDAVRTVDGLFALYPNHSRALAGLARAGFAALPLILWRKQTNAPNKFMGSGMLPPGAYVTLEHEYILILRKGPRRTFTTDVETRQRQVSAYFWEERNQWFSDVWTDLKGTSQAPLDNQVRKKSAAFPFELPFRLINMFSVRGDTVLDPFAGSGTTMYAAMATERNSIMVEKERLFAEPMLGRMHTIIGTANSRNQDRLANHCDFVLERERKKGPLKHVNTHYGFPVVTRQETRLVLTRMKTVEKITDGRYSVHYERMAM